MLSEQEQRRASLQSSDEPDEIKKAVLVKMKSVTNADEDVCIAILENKGYNLDTSVEAFFAGDFKD